MTIQQVALQQVIPIRHQVLRKNKPIETCYFNKDNEKDTYHLGVFLASKPIGICTLVHNPKKIESNNYSYQLRGMAIVEDHQGKGVGRKLLQHLPQFCFQKNISSIWCNARIKAVPFYQKHNFSSTGIPFDMAGVGMHQLMFISYE